MFTQRQLTLFTDKNMQSQNQFNQLDSKFCVSYTESRSQDAKYTSCCEACLPTCFDVTGPYLKALGARVRMPATDPREHQKVERNIIFFQAT
jgi:hypothetical protein